MVDQTKLFTETCWNSFSKLSAYPMCCCSSHWSQIYHCQPQPWLNCDTGERPQLPGSWRTRIVREIKLRRQKTTDTAWKWTNFTTQGNRFLEGRGWEVRGMWLSLTWWFFFPWWCHLLTKVTLKLTGRNPWPAQSKESLQSRIEVALACKWSFWQIGDLTGSKRLAVFAKERNPAYFWWHTHKTQRGFVKINRQPLLWRLWMWTSNSSIKPFQSRVNVIFTPILF